MIDNLRTMLAGATSILLDDGWHVVDPTATKVNGHNAEDVAVFSELAVNEKHVTLSCRLGDIKALRSVG